MGIGQAKRASNDNARAISLALLMLATRHAVALGRPIPQYPGGCSGSVQVTYPSRELLTTSSSSSAAISALPRAPTRLAAVAVCMRNVSDTPAACLCVILLSYLDAPCAYSIISAMALCRTKAGRGTGRGKCVIEASAPGRFGVMEINDASLIRQCYRRQTWRPLGRSARVARANTTHTHRLAWPLPTRLHTRCT